MLAAQQLDAKGSVIVFAATMLMMVAASFLVALAVVAAKLVVVKLADLAAFARGFMADRIAAIQRPRQQRLSVRVLGVKNTSLPPRRTQPLPQLEE